MKIAIKFLPIVLLIVFSVLTRAEPSVQQAHDLVNKKIHELLEDIEQSKRDKRFTDEQKIALVDNALGSVVDFERIARRVMAKYFKSATAEQKQRFLKVFRTSLLNTYAKGLWEFNDYKVNVLPFKDANQTLRNTQVSFEVITSSGQVFPVTQSLFYSSKENKWMVQNVIINGINMGLLFREQFSRLVAQENGDIDLAIQMWTSEVSKDSASDQSNSTQSSELEE